MKYGYLLQNRLGRIKILLVLNIGTISRLSGGISIHKTTDHMHKTMLRPTRHYRATKDV